MSKTWYCYECRNGHGVCHYPCEYTDPHGELKYPPLVCVIGLCRWKQTLQEGDYRYE